MFKYLFWVEMTLTALKNAKCVSLAKHAKNNYFSETDEEVFINIIKHIITSVRVRIAIIKERVGDFGDASSESRGV